jgi:hypothetical protein
MRCFVPRVLPFTTGTLLMATCSAGMAHDRAKTGHDHTTAVRPSEVAQQPAPARTCEPAERARGTAVALEQENAEMVRLAREALALLPQVGACSCDDPDDLVFDRENCSYCKVAGLLTAVDFVADPTGVDRFKDALAGLSS